MQFQLCIEEGNLDFSLAPLGTLQIDQIWIDEEHRRKGHGTRLLRHFLAFADALGASVRLQARGDIPAEILVGFYQAHDFTLIDPTPYIMEMVRA